MIVYHGTTMVLKEPNVAFSKEYLDFGKGFYVTAYQEQTERWALRKGVRTIKKKIVFLIIGIIGAFIFVQYRNNADQGKVDEVVLEFGDSKKFDREEIHAAMTCVLNEFKSYKGCTLQRLYYDESVSDNEFGSDNTNGIVLLSDYSADVSYSGSDFQPDKENKGYSWLLVRDSKTSKWELKSCGYA